MDESTMQILQMIAALTSGKNGASRSDLEKVITSPLIGLLTGGYDPMALVPRGGEGGELWSRYSQTQDPELQSIIETIRSGGDKYQVERAVDEIYDSGGKFDELGAMLPERIKSLAEDLRKEYQQGPKGGGGLASQFQEWGLANPLEQYTSETAPLTTQGAQLRSMMAQRMADMEAQSAEARKGASKARAKVKKESRSDRETMPGWLKPFAWLTAASTGNRYEQMSRPNKPSKESKAALDAAAKTNTDATWALMQARANELAFNQGLEQAIAEKGGNPFQTQLGQRLAMAKFLGL